MRLPLLGLLLLSAPPAAADTLREALVKAYQTNPQLGGGRANIEAAQQEIEIARALRRPTVSATVGLNQDFDTFGGFVSDGRNVTASAGIELPLFRGGLIRSSIAAARARRDSAELNQDALENDVFQDATAAYEDVRRDAEVVDLNRNNVRVLGEQLRAARDRFEVGDLTRTDVAQSQARLSRAESQLREAEAQLVRSEQFYVRVVGDAPRALAPPPPLGELPSSPEQTVELARAENPNLLAARTDAEAARFDIGVARSALRPTLSTSLSNRYTNFLGSARDGLGLPSSVSVDNDQVQQSAGLNLTIPFYSGGANTARVRQAQAFRSQALAGITVTDRNVVEAARNAYESLIAARAVIRSAEEQVRANEVALEGVRAENSVGLRTVLDVLDAEQELLNSRVELVRARRNEYVAGFAVLAAIGRATAEGLALPVQPAVAASATR